jgi:hypothetical protein
MPDLQYFDISEFDCPCCGENKMRGSFLGRLDTARHLAQVAFKVNSGYRCSKHNRDVGGKDNSAHPDGSGADIEALNSRPRFLIVSSLISAGFKRIGIAKTFIHVDNSKTNDPDVMWVY